MAKITLTIEEGTELILNDPFIKELLEKFQETSRAKGLNSSSFDDRVNTYYNALHSLLDVLSYQKLGFPQIASLKDKKKNPGLMKGHTLNEELCCGLDKDPRFILSPLPFLIGDKDAKRAVEKYLTLTSSVDTISKLRGINYMSLSTIPDIYEKYIKCDNSYTGIVIDPNSPSEFCLTRPMMEYVVSQRTNDDWRKAVKEISLEQASKIKIRFAGNDKKPVETKERGFSVKIDPTSREKVIVEEEADSLLQGSMTDKDFSRLLKFLPLDKTLTKNSEKFFSFFHDFLGTLDKEFLLLPEYLDFPDDATKESFAKNGYSGMKISNGKNVGCSNLYIDYGEADKKQEFLVLFTSTSRALKYGGANYLGTITTIGKAYDDYLEKLADLSGIEINPTNNGGGLCLPRCILDYLVYCSKEADWERVKEKIMSDHGQSLFPIDDFN